MPVAEPLRNLDLHADIQALAADLARCTQCGSNAHGYAEIVLWIIVVNPEFVGSR